MTVRGENNPRQIAITEWSKSEQAARDAEIQKSRARQAEDAAERERLNAALLQADKQRRLAELKAELEPPPPAPAAAPVVTAQPAQLRTVPRVVIVPPISELSPEAFETCRETFIGYHTEKRAVDRGEWLYRYMTARGYGWRHAGTQNEQWERAQRARHDISSPEAFAAFDDGTVSAFQSANRVVGRNL